MRERWADVRGLEGVYRVSTRGRVKSLPRTINGPWGPRRIPGKIITPNLAGRGKYRRVVVHLWQGNKRKAVGLARLVLEAFHGPPPTPEHEACHFPDRDPRNCAADNLRWGTTAENHADKHAHGTMPHGERHWNARLTWKKARTIRRRRAKGELVSKIAADLDIPERTAWDVVHGKTWKEDERA